MAFSASQTDVAGTEVSLLTVAASEVVLVRVDRAPAWFGPTGVTPTTGLRVDPRDGVVPIPATAGSHELFAIALAGASSRVHVLRRPNA